MIAAAALLGGTLLGMLPFVLQLAVVEVGASETATSGGVYLCAFAVAAALVQLSASVRALHSLAIIGVLLVAEAALAVRLLRSPAAGPAAEQAGVNAALLDRGEWTQQRAHVC